MLTNSIQNGYQNYELGNNKLPSQMVQEKETEQQPRLDDNSLVDLDFNPVVEESKKVSDASTADFISDDEFANENKYYDYNEQVKEFLEYNHKQAQERTNSTALLGLNLDITI